MDSFIEILFLLKYSLGSKNQNVKRHPPSPRHPPIEVNTFRFFWTENLSKLEFCRKECLYETSRKSVKNCKRYSAGKYIQFGKNTEHKFCGPRLVIISRLRAWIQYLSVSTSVSGELDQISFSKANNLVWWQLIFVAGDTVTEDSTRNWENAQGCSHLTESIRFLGLVLNKNLSFHSNIEKVSKNISPEFLYCTIWETRSTLTF